MNGFIQLHLLTADHTHGHGGLGQRYRCRFKRQPRFIHCQAKQGVLDPFSHVNFGILENGKAGIGSEPVDIFLHQQDIGFVSVENH
ncbi:hypothetical protein D3C76_488810 [compost metagenome]